MPTVTVTHEEWCVEHTDDSCGQGEICAFTLPQFGSEMTDSHEDTYRRGSMWVDQSESDDGPQVHLEYASVQYGAMNLAALTSIRAALVDDPAALLASIELVLDTISAKGSV